MNLINQMTTADVAEALRLAGEAEPLLNAEFAEWLPGRKGAIYRVVHRDRSGGIAEAFVLVTHFSRGSMTATFRV